MPLRFTVVAHFSASMPHPLQLTVENDAFSFEWDLVADQAQVSARPSGDRVWSGSLLPLFRLVDPVGAEHAVGAVVDPASTVVTSSGADVTLDLGDWGRAKLRVRVFDGMVHFERLEVNWTGAQPPALHSLLFGSKRLTPEQRSAVPNPACDNWPDWRAEGFSVASARTNPIQSFFRSWDFGHANIALGSFGPAMGTPYVAAYPRPLYAACAGGRSGWVCLGAGSIPDGALTFRVRSRSAALEWRFREDLWGAPAGRQRVWENPLWITWSSTAWEAYRDYFRAFPSAPEKAPVHRRSFWGTWGDFRRNVFDWRPTVTLARAWEADLVCIDDPWEARKGSCRPHPERLPDFSRDVAAAHAAGVGLGIWMPTGWIEDPAAEGLTMDDLLLGRDGAPVRGNWAIDPREAGQSFACLDPASPGAQRFLRERTQRVIRDYRPVLLKLDFGYGIPGPDACTSRDPALRGERLAWEYLRIIADAAHELDPTITILGYSLHPLWAAVQDQVALDDLGDAGRHEAAGHGQWSIWAALAGDRATPLMGSSGYLWSADPDVLMNSAILGSPGLNLPRELPDGRSPPPAQQARRHALFRWHRREAQWEPLWLDSDRGSLEEEPTLRSWGRLERINDRLELTALALRDPTHGSLAAGMLCGLSWSGRWILLAQDSASIFATKELVLIPIASGAIELPWPDAAPKEIRRVFATGDEACLEAIWRKGRLHLHADEACVASPLLGFVVRR